MSKDTTESICRAVLNTVKKNYEIYGDANPIDFDIKPILDSSVIKGKGECEIKKRRQTLGRLLYKLSKIGLIEGYEKESGETILNINDLIFIEKQAKLANSNRYRYKIIRNFRKVLNDPLFFDLITQIVSGTVDLSLVKKYMEIRENESIEIERGSILKLVTTEDLSNILRNAQLNVKRGDPDFVYDIMGKAFKEMGLLQ